MRTTSRFATSAGFETSLLLGGTVLALATGVVRADTLLVRADGTGDHPTIQAALDASEPSDIIELADGVFRGPGNRDVTIPERGATLVRSRSGDPDACVIDCEGSAAEPHRAFLVVDDDLWLIGVTIRGGYVDDDTGGGAIASIRSWLPLESCRFIENESATRGGALSVIGETDAFQSAELSDCTFAGNRAARGGAISIDAAPIIERCVLAGNVATDVGGAIYGTTTGDVRQTTIAGNRAATAGGAVYVSDWLDVTTTIFWANCAPIGASVVLGKPTMRGGGIRCSIVRVEDVAGDVVLHDTNQDENPLLCDPRACSEAPTIEGDHALDAASVCLAERSPCGDRIGALDVSCVDTTPVTRASWSLLKSRY